MNSLNNLEDMLFGEVGKDYCDLFYYLMLVNFLIVVAFVLTVIGYILRSKKVDMRIVAGGVVQALILSIGYFQHRILYSMCMRS